jgi:hypothetical protein
VTVDRGAKRDIDSPEKMRSRHRIFRKQLVLPAEHGSWSWLLVPYFAGVIVAGGLNLPALLVLIGGLAGFLVRQPASTYMRVRAGRGRKADEPIAAFWAAFFALLALICFVGLLILGRAALLWLLVPMAAILTLYLLASRHRRANMRTLWMELAGAAGLSAMAPAAYIAVAGNVNGIAWLLWGLMAGQNVSSVFYVRARIADTHQRPYNRSLLLWAHLSLLLAVTPFVLIGIVSWLAIVPFVAYLVRAVWAFYGERPLKNIRSFGFREVGVQSLGGLLIAAGFLV